MFFFDELDTCITIDEVHMGISKMKTGKASGPDLIVSEFIVASKDILAPYMCRMFNVVFDTGLFPETWALGEVIPLHKKGSRNEVENYRGITLLSVVGKLFTNILNTRLTKWADDYGMYIEAQAGFRAGYGTTDNVFVLSGIINQFLASKKKLYAVFVDFCKAFDYVKRDALWYKLFKYGVRGKMLIIMKSMYTHVKSYVRTATGVSETFYCSHGVRQGESLSPFLFAMFINDMEETFASCPGAGIHIADVKLFLLLYADDSVIFAESAQGLKESLVYLSEYCNRWGLKVNVDKTKVVIFRKGGPLKREDRFTYNECELAVVSEFKYLGITFTPGGAFTRNQQVLADQARKALFTLTKCTVKFPDISPIEMCQLFDKLVRPILEYGAEVWGFHSCKDIEQLHLSFCKNILGVRRSTPNDFVYNELGRLPLAFSRKVKIIKYWVKVLRLPEYRLVKIMYRDMLQNEGKKSWATDVRDLLMSIGFGDVWMQQYVGDEKLFLSLIQTRLRDIELQNLRERVNQSGKALTYKHIVMDVFCPEKYLEVVNIQTHRYALSRLRMSSHRLAIETGRWHRPPLPNIQRHCNICNELEDEYHFTLQCVRYAELRQLFIPKFYRTRPSMEKFTLLMQDKRVWVLKKLANYVYKAFKKRNAELYKVPVLT